MRLEEFFAMKREVEEENEWRYRPENVYTRDGKALVSIVSTSDRQLKQAIKQAVERCAPGLASRRSGIA